MCQSDGSVINTRKEPSKMQVSTIGLDLAKQVFQVHGVDAAGAVVLRRWLRRSEVVRFFSTLPSCLIGPLCQNSCRLDRIGGLGEWTLGNGPIRTSV